MTCKCPVIIISFIRIELNQSKGYTYSMTESIIYCRYYNKPDASYDFIYIDCHDKSNITL